MSEENASRPPTPKDHEENETFEDARDRSTANNTPSRDQSRSRSITRSLTANRSGSASSRRESAEQGSLHHRMASETRGIPEDQEPTSATLPPINTDVNPSAKSPELQNGHASDLDEVDLDAARTPRVDKWGRAASVSSQPPKLPPRDGSPATVSRSSNSSIGRSPSPNKKEKDGIHNHHPGWVPQAQSKSTGSATLSPPAVEKPAQPEKPAAPTRKFTSPFSWLRSKDSEEKKATAAAAAAAAKPTSPETPATKGRRRRSTNASLTTVGSGRDLMLGRIQDGEEEEDKGPRQPSARDSLRERFKFMRMKEEAGVHLDDSERRHSVPESQVTSPATDDGKDTKTSTTPTPIEGKNGSTSTTSTTAPSLPLPNMPAPPAASSKINESLPPGTASGATAGPATDDGGVDWDLWQEVVYEGPTAVARKSPDELSVAITNGIPQAIRGVVWQVLASSKNEDLEPVYRELVARGTDKEKQMEKDRETAPVAMSRQSSATTTNAKEKDSVNSSASSVHSEASTPATSAMTSSPLPDTTNAEQMAKLQAKLAAERQAKVQLDAKALQKLEKTIRKDLGSRTSFSKIASAQGLQEGLFGVCKAYALFDEAVGYPQGLNFIVMPLLFNMPEEEAFCLLVRLMNRYQLRDMFIKDMPGLHLHLYRFERLLEDTEPQLYVHLRRRNVTPELYATQWFLTFFAYRFPLQLVLRIYDLILSEGLAALLKFGMVLMSKNADTLLAMQDMQQLTNFLKEKLFDTYIDRQPSEKGILDSGFFGSASGIDKDVYRADELVRDACAVSLTPEMLRTYTTEWEEKERVRKASEAETENLKASNSALHLKVKALEERAQAHDTEHVTVASDLVRTKVENEHLLEQKEGLETKVSELQTMLEKQPEQVEARLKDEMDRIMQRNLEVQNANRSLEDQMAEMEKALVEMKMSWAQLNSDHENLKQKWSNLQQMLK